MKHRIKIGLVEKDKIRQLPGLSDWGIFLHFRIAGVIKPEKTCFHKKHIIGNIQNDLLYKKY